MMFCKLTDIIYSHMYVNLSYFCT